MIAIPIALGLAAFITIGTLKAQNTPSTSVTEPQYINSFYAADANGKVIELERETVTFHTKMKVLPGYASVKMTTEFKPGHSPVRVAAIAQFIVRGRTPIDPLSRFELRALKSSKDHREFVMTRGHGSVLGGAATSNLDEGAVAIRFEEHGVSSYRNHARTPACTWRVRASTARTRFRTLLLWSRPLRETSLVETIRGESAAPPLWFSFH